MARGPCTFRQRDLACALRATIAAGIGVQRVEIEGGKIVIIPGTPPEQSEPRPEANEWDKVE